MMLSIFTNYFLPAIILGGIGCLFGALIAICAKKFFVKTDERVEKVTSLLPGYNCGGCGCAGCSGLAQEIVDKKKDASCCKPIKKDKVLEIKEYLSRVELELNKEKK